MTFILFFGLLYYGDNRTFYSPAPVAMTSGAVEFSTRSTCEKAANEWLTKEYLKHRTLTPYAYCVVK